MRSEARLEVVKAGVGVEPIVRELQAHVPNHLGLALRPCLQLKNVARL
jgi:hypothetical protein